jgi:UPF0755 protein
MKKFKIFGIVIVLFGAIAAYLGFKGATNFKGKTKTIIIRQNETSRAAVEKILKKDSIDFNSTAFKTVASLTSFWDKIKPGRYEITNGASAYSIIKSFKNGLQKPVKLSIVKIRTKEELAKVVGKNFAIDSANFLKSYLNVDSLKALGIDSSNFLSSIIPNTYEIYFDANGKTILKKIFEESKKFWTKERIEKAKAKNLSVQQVLSIASIVEEETNINDEKGNVASVYINRFKRKMKLQADPTVIFATKKFGVKQVTFDMLKYPSPYNTYYSMGLPPGPICTPSVKTIDATLNAPETPFIFFVANSDFSGKHIFTTNEKDHATYAALWRTALAEQRKMREQKKAANQSKPQ